MSLNSALNSAQLSLSANAKQLAVSARNVAGASDPNYSRKLASLTTFEGGVLANGPARAGDAKLYERYLESLSVASRENALLSGLGKLSATVGDTAAGTSLVARIGKLTEALTDYANAPNNESLGRAAVAEAKELVRSLHEAASVVQKVRAQAEEDVNASVDRINGLLAEFEQANNQVISGTVNGRDVTDAQDQRDSIIKQLSNEIGVSVVERGNGDYVLYTDSGVTLFETYPREVKAIATVPGESHVYIDGVRVTGNGSPAMLAKQGQLVGLIALRDGVAKTYAEQLDEVALGLIDAFKEVDTVNAPAGATLAGLFTNAADPAVPADTTPPVGGGAGWLAAAIQINEAVDPDAAGGDVSRLRDGITYTYNPDAPAGQFYSGRLFHLIGDQGLGAKTVGVNNESVLDYAASSISWLEGRRKTADNAVKTADTAQQVLEEALSNTRGVDLNDEAALQLQLERSYSASAQIFAVVDAMFKSLLEVVR